MDPVYTPFLILGAGIAFIIVAIVVLRLHAFLALMLAAIFVGILASLPDLTGDWLSSVKSLTDAEGDFEIVKAFELTSQEFGTTAGKIGLVIILASIIGKCLMDSGAADKITRTLLNFLSEKLSGLALMGSGFVLSIPVFFDTVFYLLVPLAKALRLRTGKNYLLYILCISAGGVLTHSLVAPTPGPLIMAENLRIDLGVTILAGITFSIIPALLGGWLFGAYLNRKVEIPLREVEGTSLAELETIVKKPDSELPGFLPSMLPIILPVVMISSDTAINSWNAALLNAGEDPVSPTTLYVFGIVGNKTLALLVSTLLAVMVYLRHTNLTYKTMFREFEPAISSAGIIILITSAGGAFGGMIKRIGVQESIETLMERNELTGADSIGTTLILLGFGLAMVMKIAQGSGTVSMITASLILWGIIGTGEGTEESPYMLKMQLPYHPVYLFLAIGFGSKMFSWMNDSGFWIVSKMSGFTEKETLKTWTPLLAMLGIIGLVQILIASKILPLNFLESLPLQEGVAPVEPPVEPPAGG